MAMKMSPSLNNEQLLADTTKALLNVREDRRAALSPRSLNIISSQQPSPPNLKAPPPSRKESCESLRDPQVVDIADVEPWPRRISALLGTQRVSSPSATPSYGGRQSEISLSILDHHIPEQTSSLCSPDSTPLTPRLDMTIKQFDFGLPATPKPLAVSATSSAPSSKPHSQEEKDRRPLHPSPASSATSSRQSSGPQGNGYYLFPVIKEAKSSPRQPTIITPNPTKSRDQTQQDPMPPFEKSSCPHGHTAPAPSYRPRKESISSSVRSRTDSLITSSNIHAKRNPTRHISADSVSTPLVYGTRIPSSSASTPTTSSAAAAHDRWSDDSVTSPSWAPTPGPRTSFGSLLRHTGTPHPSYPACFFEESDEDGEEVPLRRKRGWVNRGNWKRTPRSGDPSLASKRGGARSTLGKRLARIMLCSTCCGGGGIHGK